MGKLNIALGMILILYPSAQADATRTGRGHCSLLTVNCSLNDRSIKPLVVLVYPYPTDVSASSCSYFLGASSVYTSSPETLGFARDSYLLLGARTIEY